MSKVLICHHVQPMWFKEFKPIDKYRYIEQLMDHLDSESYDRVIITYFDGENIHSDDDFYELYSHADMIYEYGYCWYGDSLIDYDELRESMSDEEWDNWYYDPDDLPDELEAYGQLFVRNRFTTKWNDGAYSLIDDWMKQLCFEDEIFLCGMHDGECVSDMETALTYLKLPYIRLEQFILSASDRTDPYHLRPYRRYK